MANPSNRIIVLIDMDCFFCQVETKLQPEHAGKPLAVVQYNQWEMGGIIAVNYEARSFGVTRHMRGKEAKEKCPDLVLASVPCLRGKADTSRYRKAGREVIEVIKKYCNVIERASVDEAYLDITEIVDNRLSANKISPKEVISSLKNTYIVGYSKIDKNDEEERQQGLKTWILNSFQELCDTQAQKLAIAGIITEEIRTGIYEETGFKCSAGIAQNKVLAKLACGLHKPNRQTILPEAAIPNFYSTLSIKKVRNLGGKFGDVVVKSLGCNVMGDLLQYSLEQLQEHFDEKTALWLYNIARGVDNEPVTNRLLPKSIGACKKFPGKQAIISLEVLKHWTADLVAEVCERLEQDHLENQRRATLLTVSYHYYQNKSTVSQSRSLALNSYKPEKMASQCVNAITKSTQCPIAYIGICAGKFVQSKGSDIFMKFFKSIKPEDREKATSDLEICKSGTIDSPGDTTDPQFNVKSKEEFLPSKDLFQNSEPVVNRESTNNEAIIKESKTIVDNSLDLNAEDSPTSTRLFKLIQVCNERGKMKSKNKRTSNVGINNNDFKSSFFMNIYKTKREDDSDNIDVNIETVDETQCEKKTSTVSGINNLNSIGYFAEDVTNDVTSENIAKNIDDRNSNMCMQMHDNHDKPSTSSTSSHLHSSGKDFNECNEKSKQNPLVRLQEIFPNMEDIDPDVLFLLPADLQEEARLYMKSRSKKQENTKVFRDLAKVSKGKSNKSIKTTNKRRSPLYNFLIKTDSVEHDAPLKRCAECDQMIIVTKYREHMDFHVAQSLHREINKPMPGENGAKRKLKNTEADKTSVKRQLNVCKVNRDIRSITTFLS